MQKKVDHIYIIEVSKGMLVKYAMVIPNIIAAITKSS